MPPDDDWKKYKRWLPVEPIDVFATASWTAHVNAKRKIDEQNSGKDKEEDSSKKKKIETNYGTRKKKSI